ncbi:MAG: TonB family protein [Chitinispirillaceae bacterium]
MTDPVGFSSACFQRVDKAMVKEVKGSFFTSVDPRLFWVVLLSLLVHGIVLYYLSKQKVSSKQDIVVIERIPERFARLIVDKPVPKVKKSATSTGETEGTGEKARETAPVSKSAKPTVAQRRKAARAVEKRSAKVEQKVRNVGVLGMLTGVGKTAKGPAVADVLGSDESSGNNSSSLDEALENMAGLKKTQNLDVLDKKLVKSKDVSVAAREEIDDLIAGVGGAKSVDLSKRGDFMIQRPESIEGAASSSAKRDNSAVNRIVSSHRASIRMTYQKYLRRDPSLAGKITVRFTITSSGSISVVEILENTTGNDQLEREIVRKIRMWQFDEIPDGDVSVTYPFVFSPAA